MKVSLNWLKTYVPLDVSVEEITHAITFLGFEVEQVIRTGLPPLTDVVVGEVLTRDRHPNADQLTVCQVDVGPAGGDQDHRLRRAQPQGRRPGARSPCPAPCFPAASRSSSRRSAASFPTG